ncbi:unnamed protein product [Closterium sp. Naga37s-1]|nr:unnamed protein product [Closterium sp. Naga37s-1]
MQAPGAAGGSHAAPGGSFQPSTGAVAAPAGPVIAGPPGTIPPDAGFPGAGGAPGAGGGVAGGVAGASPVMQPMPGGMQHMQPYMIPPMGPDMHGMYYPGNGYIPHYYYDYSMPGYADPPRMPSEQWEEYMRMAARMEGGAGMMDGQQPPVLLCFSRPYSVRPRLAVSRGSGTGKHPSMMGAHMFGAPPPGYPFPGGPMFQLPLLRPPSPGDPAQPGDSAQPGAASAHIRPGHMPQVIGAPPHMPHMPMHAYPRPSPMSSASPPINPLPMGRGGYNLLPRGGQQPMGGRGGGGRGGDGGGGGGRGGGRGWGGNRRGQGPGGGGQAGGGGSGGGGSGSGAGASAAAGGGGAGAGAGAGGAAGGGGGTTGGAGSPANRGAGLLGSMGGQGQHQQQIGQQGQQGQQNGVYDGSSEQNRGPRTGRSRGQGLPSPSAPGAPSAPMPIGATAGAIGEPIGAAAAAAAGLGAGAAGGAGGAMGAAAAAGGARGGITLRPDEYNRADFKTSYEAARFFVIKSYSEDDVHKSIKYGVWASTPTGNKRLDAAFKDAAGKSSATPCPLFLFFSVNASGQFCGVAEMLTPVDFTRSVDYWQQDKWNGHFQVKWHVIKDVPNSQFRHIIIASNDGKPVTNSRDTQEWQQDKWNGHLQGCSFLPHFPVVPPSFPCRSPLISLSFPPHFPVVLPSFPCRSPLISLSFSPPPSPLAGATAAGAGNAAAVERTRHVHSILSHSLVTNNLLELPHSPSSLLHSPLQVLLQQGQEMLRLFKRYSFPVPYATQFPTRFPLARCSFKNRSSMLQVPLQQGQEMLRLFKGYSSRTSILDDFNFYDSRQRAMQERKTRHPSHPFPHQQHSQHLQHQQQQHQQQQQQHQQQQMQHQHPNQQQQMQHQHMQQQQQQHQQHQQQLQQQRRIVVGRNAGPVLLPQPRLDARPLEYPFPPLMPLGPINPAFGPAGLPLPANAAPGAAVGAAGAAAAGGGFGGHGRMMYSHTGPVGDGEKVGAAASGAATAGAGAGGAAGAGAGTESGGAAGGGKQGGEGEKAGGKGGETAAAIAEGVAVLSLGKGEGIGRKV